MVQADKTITVEQVLRRNKGLGLSHSEFEMVCPQPHKSALFLFTFMEIQSYKEYKSKIKQFCRATT